MDDDKRREITQAYALHILEHGDPPASVFKFCKEHQIEEREFYETFSSFAAIEASIWSGFVDETLQVLDTDREFGSYPVDQKILSFLYTFLERALDQRSFMLARQPGLNPRDPAIKKMLCHYNSGVKRWLEAGEENGEIARRGRLNDAYSSVFSFHLLLVIDFWLKDESAQFQRTDAYVEKTVKLVSELIRTQAGDAAIDLVRFLAGVRQA